MAAQAAIFASFDNDGEGNEVGSDNDDVVCDVAATVAAAVARKRRRMPPDSAASPSFEIEVAVSKGSPPPGSAQARAAEAAEARQAVCRMRGVHRPARGKSRSMS